MNQETTLVTKEGSHSRGSGLSVVSGERLLFGLAGGRGNFEQKGKREKVSPGERRKPMGGWGGCLKQSWK